MCHEVGIDSGGFSRYGSAGVIPDGAILSALCKWANLNAANYSVDLRGECDEECGELSAICARCIIQGLDGVDPKSGKKNRDALREEMADVFAQITMNLDTAELGLGDIDIQWVEIGMGSELFIERVREKRAQMREWESMFKGNTK